jgi:tRNA pseudouridine55 synthase
MDGVLVVDKPEGPTSHDVVAAVRHAIGVRAVGHTGTLDPMASGVLPLVIGRATRLARFLAAHDKTYDATIRLGSATDTWDRTGRAAGESTPIDRLPAPDDIRGQLTRFLGVHEQLPPPFSAKKVGGIRAHRLARNGQEVAVRPTLVTLHELEILGVDAPLVSVRVRCSAGYYVRALAHDLGRQLGCGACLESLRRLEAGGFTMRDAATLDDIVREPAQAAGRVVPMERLLPDLPALRLSEEDARRVAHGNAVRPAGAGALTVAGGAGAVRLVSPDGTLLAIAFASGGAGVLHPAIVLK